MNRVTLIGNLTADPVERTTTGGTVTTNFTLAVGRRYRDSDGNRQTDFFFFFSWNKTAELISKHLSKGSKAGVSGSLQTRSWEDIDGNRHHVTEVVVDEVEFLSPKQQSEESFNFDSYDAPF